jgi:hypothetical protein
MLNAAANGGMNNETCPCILVLDIQCKLNRDTDLPRGNVLVWVCQSCELSIL